jgi:hypothetical protein
VGYTKRGYDMSNDPYEDLTDEEKALLKREMKFRIEQQRSREKSEKYAPQILLGMGFFFTLVICLSYLVFSNQSLARYRVPIQLNWAMLCFMIAPGAFFSVLAFIAWRKRRNDASGDPSIKTKNKRG